MKKKKKIDTAHIYLYKRATGLRGGVLRANRTTARKADDCDVVVASDRPGDARETMKMTTRPLPPFRSSAGAAVRPFRILRWASRSPNWWTLCRCFLCFPWNGRPASSWRLPVRDCGFSAKRRNKNNNSLRVIIYIATCIVYTWVSWSIYRLQLVATLLLPTIPTTIDRLARHSIIAACPNNVRHQLCQHVIIINGNNTMAFDWGSQSLRKGTTWSDNEKKKWNAVPLIRAQSRNQFWFWHSKAGAKESVSFHVTSLPA